MSNNNPPKPPTEMPSKDTELREAIQDAIAATNRRFDETGFYQADIMLDEIMDLITEECTRIKAAADFNPFDFVHPCEPDCSPDRHAYHQGQWDMAVGIDQARTTIEGLK